MLELTIEQSRLASDPCLQCRDEVEEWCDSEGTVCAYGWVSAETYRIRFPGLATFSFTPRSNRVSASPAPGAGIDDVRETFYHSVLPLALQVMGWEALHASAVRSSAGVVALCAVSGTGKSTLAYALDRAGWSIWADDAVVVRADLKVPTVTPLPFSLRLRSASQAHFGDFEKRGVLLPPRDASAGSEEPLAAIFVLERSTPESAGRHVTVSRLVPSAAFPAVLEHAYCFTLGSAPRMAALVDHYLSLSERVPVYGVRFTPGFEHLDSLVQAVRSTVEMGLWS